MTSKQALIYVSKNLKAFAKEYGDKINKTDNEALQVLKQALERLEKLEEALKLLNIMYEWQLEEQEYDDGQLGYFICSPYEDSYNSLTEDQYNNFKEVLEYINTLYT